MSYEIRAMTLGEILDTSFRLVRNHFAPLVGMSAAVYMPYFLVATGLQTRLQAQLASGSGGELASSFLGLFGAVLTLMVVGPIVSAAIYYSISEVYVGRPIQVQAALREALRIVLPLLGTSFLNVLGLSLGFLLLIVPGVWFLLGTMVLYPISIVERSFGFTAIGRSLDLMKGHRGRAFLLYLLVFVLSIVFQGAFGLIGTISPWMGGLAQGLATSLLAVFQGAITIVLYFDIRCRKEAFDVEHLARLVQSGAAA